MRGCNLFERKYHPFGLAQRLSYSSREAPGLFGSRKPKIHHGFLDLYTTADPNSEYSTASLRDQIFETLKALGETYKKEEVTITVCGHNLGGALATPVATDLVLNGPKKPIVTAIVFASPKVGDSAFHELVSELGNVLHILRVRNGADLVPHLPPCTDYKEVGEELKVGLENSPNPRDLIADHSLQTYLKLVAEGE